MPVTHKPTEVPVALQKCMGMAESYKYTKYLLHKIMHEIYSLA